MISDESESYCAQFGMCLCQMPRQRNSCCSVGHHPFKNKAMWWLLASVSESEERWLVFGPHKLPKVVVHRSS